MQRDRDRFGSGLLAVLTGLGTVLAGCAAPEPLPGQEAQPPWSWQMPECVAYRPAELAAPGHRRSVRVREEPGRREQVEEYEPGWGPRALAEIRTVVRECGRYEAGRPGGEAARSGGGPGRSGGEAGFLAQHRVLATGFAGDESLLVETVHLAPPETRTWYTAVVRRGDRVTTVRTDSLAAAEAGCLVVADQATCA